MCVLCFNVYLYHVIKNDTNKICMIPNDIYVYTIQHTLIMLLWNSWLTLNGVVETMICNLGTFWAFHVIIPDISGDLKQFCRPPLKHHKANCIDSSFVQKHWDRIPFFCLFLLAAKKSHIRSPSGWSNPLHFGELRIGTSVEFWEDLSCNCWWGKKNEPVKWKFGTGPNWTQTASSWLITTKQWVIVWLHNRGAGPSISGRTWQSFLCYTLTTTAIRPCAW